MCEEAVAAREDSIKQHKLAYVDEEVLVELVSESQLGEALTGESILLTVQPMGTHIDTAIMKTRVQ